MRVWTFFCLVALLGNGFLRYVERYLDPKLKILFLDVGQGDGALVMFPGGRTLLIDAGGGFREFDIGKKEILPELARRGILTLNDALLTHPDQDHGYGFTSLLSEMKVERFWVSADLVNASPIKPLMQQLTTLAVKRSTSLHSVDRPVKTHLNGVDWEVWPSRGVAKNDWALLSRLQFGACSILFTADIEKVGEANLICSLSGPVSLLKVAHHGSQTSSTEAFLNWARPQWAVISTGHRNRYGHPHRDVLKRLKHFNTQVFRTDFHGFVEFHISKKGEVDCFSAEGYCGKGSCR